MLFVNHVSMAGQKAVSTLMGENLIDLKYIRGTYVHTMSAPPIIQGRKIQKGSRRRCNLMVSF